MKKTLLIVLCTSFLFSQIREEITERHENGVKKTIIVYKGTGTKENLIKKLKYYDNENIESSTEWNHGIEDGLYTYWYNDGQKEQEGNYKDGEKDGKWTKWDNDGQKQSEETYKDGQLDGLVTAWYENGQKKREVIYKDGKRISYKIWNRDSSVNK